MTTIFNNALAKQINDILLQSELYTDYVPSSGVGRAHLNYQSRYLHEKSGYNISVTGQNAKYCILVSNKNFWDNDPEIKEFLENVGENVGSSNLPDTLNKNNTLVGKNHEAQRLKFDTKEQFETVKKFLSRGGFKSSDENSLISMSSEVNAHEASLAGFNNSEKETGNKVMHLKRERNPKFVRNVKKIHGNKCEGCMNDYSTIYGVLWNGFVEAHHLWPIKDIAEETILNPKEHGCVLCSNCHRMMHRWMSSEDVKDRLEYNRNDLSSFRKEVIEPNAEL